MLHIRIFTSAHTHGHVHLFNGEGDVMEYLGIRPSQFHRAPHDAATDRTNNRDILSLSLTRCAPFSVSPPQPPASPSQFLLFALLRVERSIQHTPSTHGYKPKYTHTYAHTLIISRSSQSHTIHVPLSSSLFARTIRNIHIYTYSERDFSQ